MKFDVEKLGEKLTPCYVDDNGNLISVINSVTENKDWCVARISKEGDVEVIEFFKDENAAKYALPVICQKNGWTLRRN